MARISAPPRDHGAARALVWSFANTALSRAGTLGIGIVLARLLGPEAFGTYAVGFVALVALLSLNDLGVSLAIVRWPGDPREIAPTITTITLLTSIVVFGAGYVAAPAFASSMGSPEATGVLRLLLVSVLVDGAVATPAALLQRAFRQDRRTIADQTNVWLGAIISVVLAALGLGAISLAIGRVVGSMASGVLLLIFSPLPYRLGFDRTKARALLAFGLPLAGASVVVFAAGNADQLVVGQVLGPTLLGFYVLAFNVSSWPVSMFSAPMRAVAPAAFARLHERPEERTRGFGAILAVLSAVALPTCAFLVGGADPIVRFVYGAQWAPAADVLRWLAVLGGLRILFELAYDYVVVLGRSRTILGIQIVWVVVLIPALILAAHLAGVDGVAFAAATVAVVVVLPLYLRQLHRGGLPLRMVGRTLALPIAASVAVGVVAFVAAALIPFDLVACLVGGVAALAAMAILVLRRRDALAQIRALGKSDDVGAAASGAVVP